MEEKTFKVIKILDSETILLNAGKNDGIKVGDKFEIYETGKEILDPDTNDSLGTLDIIKETLTADSVLEKMCVCRHHIPSTFAAVSAISLLHAAGGYKSLNVDKTQMSNELDEDHMIRVGDKARKKVILPIAKSTND